MLMFWMEPLFWGLIAAVAGVRLLLLLWYVWENRRFARSRVADLSGLERLTQEPKVALLMPCKGADEQLKQNLAAILEQNYTNYEVLFIVESEKDPAAGVIQQVINEHPTAKAKLVVAGLCGRCSQKIHNLLSALGLVEEDTEILTFVDADARLRSPNWLAGLVKRLLRPGTAAVTTYRWLHPSAETFPNVLVSSLNASAASLIASRKRRVVWGGGWAIWKKEFDKTKIAERWAFTLSDDLVATRVLKQVGLQVDYEPACVVRSDVDYSWSSALEFLRRQYLIGRIYLPRLWFGMFLGATLGVVGFWGPAIAALELWLKAVPGSTLLAAVVGVVYLLHASLAVLRQSFGQVFGLQVGRRQFWWDVLGSPVLALANWLIMLSAVVGRRVCWRGICYDLDRHGRVLQVARRDGQNACGSSSFPTDKKSTGDKLNEPEGLDSQSQAA